MPSGEDADAIFGLLELKEYEEEALRTLLTMGSSTAPNLAEATDVPKARIYGVLGELADRGFVKEVPGRPKTFHAKHPEEIVERAVENQRQSVARTVDAIQAARDAFEDEYGPAYERASEGTTPTEELFHVVDVGEPSETETRRLYAEADREVDVITKSFEYFDRVASAFGDAVDRGVDVRVVFLDAEDLAPSNVEVQRRSVARIREDHPAVEVRSSPGPLPWRGTFADPSMSYESGQGILLVEEKEIPLHLRQAAVTENAPFVAGMKRHFDLLWEHEATPIAHDDGAG